MRDRGVIPYEKEEPGPQKLTKFKVELFILHPFPIYLLHPAAHSYLLQAFMTACGRQFQCPGISKQQHNSTFKNDSCSRHLGELFYP